MSLIKDFNKAMANSKVRGAGNEAVFDVMYPTGLAGLDMLNAQRIFVDTPERKFSYISCGIVDGSTNCFISRSGAGKSTLSFQSGSHIILPFIRGAYECSSDCAVMFVDDIEGGLPHARREFLSNMSSKEFEEHVVCRNTDITTENVLERMTAIANMKLSNKDKYTYDTRLYDIFGNRIYKLVPTIYIIDSLALLMPEDISDKEDLGTNATGMSIAKQNTMLFKKINQLCKAANIMLLSMNHILPRPQLGFIPTQSQVDGLKPDERLAGAQTVVYLANNIFRLDEKTTLKDSEGFGINGKVVDISLVKSRTNATRKSVSVIFDKSNGGYFDNDISLLYMLKQEGKIQGVGSTCRLDSCPDVKFSLKNFREVLANSEELRIAFSKECFDMLSKLPSNTVNQKAVERVNPVSDMIYQMALECQ